MKIIPILIACLAITACAPQEETQADSVQTLSEWKGKTIQEMIRTLGDPTEETEQAVGKMPTKDWNHGIVFSIYPKNKPENQNTIIKSYSWKQGDYHVRACCHLVKKAWLVMGAKRIHNNVRF